VDEAEPYARLAAVYDEIVVDPCHRVWASYLHELWVDDPAQVHSVLDLGCGTGLMAAALTAYGYRVTGVDSSAAMLARARRLVGSEAVLIQGSMPGLGVGGVFDAVISTFDALNYLSAREFAATVAAVARRLRPGGWSSTCIRPRCWTSRSRIRSLPGRRMGGTSRSAVSWIPLPEHSTPASWSVAEPTATPSPSGIVSTSIRPPTFSTPFWTLASP
jgi:SAM-dependent methyltransferase